MQERATALLTALVVDDEALARDELIYLLRDFPLVEVIATAANGLEAVDLVLKLDPDIVFLDVQMPGLDGVGVVHRLRERDLDLPYFVFVTAFDQYAVEAFRLEAMDYLLKPVEKDRLAETIERARRFTQERTKEVAPAEVPARPAAARTKLLVRKDNRSYIVDSDDLVYATIDSGQITLVTTTIEGLSNFKTIEELQAALNRDTFWRVHRSYLVNVNRIKELVPWFRSSFQIRMDDKRQTEIPVSRVQTKRLRELLHL
jgi:two-component system LytT family response regulator/two-component system response regulator LytT